jgi:hypothetical protein
MKKNIFKYKSHILLFLCGATFGYLYYYFIGCSSGTCPISSNPYISIGYGGVLGVLSLDSLKYIKSKISQKK